MRPTEITAEINKMLGGERPSRLTTARRALSKLDMFPGWTPPTPEETAWLLFATLFAPGAGYHDVVSWIEQKRAFFDRCKEHSEPTVFHFIQAALTDPAIAETIGEVMIEPVTGSGVLATTSGKTIRLNRISDVPPTDAEIVSIVRIPGHALRRLGELVRSGMVEQVVEQN